MIPGLDSYLRPYQRAIITDNARYRVVLKSRQIGVSDLIALECALTAAGLHSALPHNCYVVSKSQRDAVGVIDKAKKWVSVLSLDPQVAPYMRLARNSSTEIQFERSRFRVVALCQSETAGRGVSGHLYFDEFAFWQLQREIFLSASPSIESNESLRMTIVSTPNGTTNCMYHEIWANKGEAFGHYSRHQIDVYQAAAEGMPINVDEVKSRYSRDQFAQEFCCEFLGEGSEYHSPELLRACRVERPRGSNKIWLGVDVASVSDHTVVQVARQYANKIVFGETYSIAGMPYRSNEAEQRIGQDRVVAALIRHYNPAVTIFDATGESGEFLGCVRALLPDRNLAGHTIRRAWKNEWVGKLKMAMQAGHVGLEFGKDYIFGKENFRRCMKDVMEKTPQQLINEGFYPASQSTLERDFGLVYKRMTQYGLTYQTRRIKGGGHGDAYWAALMAYYVAASGGVKKRVKKARAHRRSGAYTDY